MTTEPKHTRPAVDLGIPVAVFAVILFGLIFLPISFMEGRKHAPTAATVSEFRLDAPNLSAELAAMKADCGDCWQVQHPVAADMIANVPVDAILTSVIQWKNFVFVEVQYPGGRLAVRAYRWDGAWSFVAESDERS